MHCANCGTELAGEYCQSCGQHLLDNPSLAIRPFIRQFTRELLHLDFKTVHTLVALFRPGFLTKEFLDGRRARYLTPLRLYFLSAAIFFVAAPSVGFSLEDMLQQDPEGLLKNLVTARAQARGMDMPLFAERFNLRVQTVYTLSLSVSIVVAALLLRLLFRTHTLGAHLVFALHYVAFLYMGAIVIGAIEEAVSAPPLVVLAMLYAVLIPYLFIAMRRVYGQSPTRTIFKVLVMCVVTFFVDNAVNFGALLLTLWLV
jgi:hypothetical protein